MKKSKRFVFVEEAIAAKDMIKALLIKMKGIFYV